MADTTPENPAERFKRRDASRSLLDRLFTGGFGAEQSGERPDLAQGVPVSQENKPTTPAPIPFAAWDAMRTQSEESPWPESELSYLSPSELLHGLDLARQDELAALAEQRRRTRGKTVSELLKVR
jgi:hypothetical protein